MKAFVVIFGILFSYSACADFITGKISLIRNYNNNNTVIQLKDLSGSLVDKPVCLVEDQGNGAATTFQAGITGSHQEKFFSHILMAYSTESIVKIEYAPVSNNYCIISEIYSWK